MYKRTAAWAAMTAFLLSAGTAWSDPGEGSHGHGHGHGHGHDQDRDFRHDRGRHEGHGPHHDIYRGRPIPPEYRGPHYVVEDWSHHRLHRPPSGYQWVQVGGGYVLVTIGTGIVAQIVLP